jgi:hypothetical protein
MFKVGTWIVATLHRDATPSKDPEGILRRNKERTFKLLQSYTWGYFDDSLLSIQEELPPVVRLPKDF